MTANTKIFIPRYISSVTYTPARVLPHIYFYNGQTNCEAWFIEGYSGSATTSSATIVTQSVTQFPQLDYYSQQQVDSSSLSLLFNNEFTPYGTIPSQSLYSEYWETYVSLLYNPHTRLVACSAIIPLADYFTLNLNDVIEWRGNYYYLRAINDYNTANGECNLQLLGPILDDTLTIPFIPPVDCSFNFTAVTPTSTTTSTSTTSTSTTSTSTTTLGPGQSTTTTSTSTSTSTTSTSTSTSSTTTAAPTTTTTTTAGPTTTSTSTSTSTTSTSTSGPTTTTTTIASLIPCYISGAVSNYYTPETENTGSSLWNDWIGGATLSALTGSPSFTSTGVIFDGTNNLGTTSSNVGLDGALNFLFELSSSFDTPLQYKTLLSAGGSTSGTSSGNRGYEILLSKNNSNVIVCSVAEYSNSGIKYQVDLSLPNIQTTTIQLAVFVYYDSFVGAYQTGVWYKKTDNSLGIVYGGAPFGDLNAYGSNFRIARGIWKLPAGWSSYSGITGKINKLAILQSGTMNNTIWSNFFDCTDGPATTSTTSTSTSTSSSSTSTSSTSTTTLGPCVNVRVATNAASFVNYTNCSGTVITAVLGNTQGQFSSQFGCIILNSLVVQDTPATIQYDNYCGTTTTSTSTTTGGPTTTSTTTTIAPGTCLTYRATNNGGGTVAVTYVNCYNVSGSINVGGLLYEDFCAKYNTPQSLGNVTFTILSGCTVPTSTSTTTSGPTTTSTTTVPPTSTSTSTSTTSPFVPITLVPSSPSNCTATGGSFTAYAYIGSYPLQVGYSIYASQNFNDYLVAGYYSDGTYNYQVAGNFGTIVYIQSCSSTTSTTTIGPGQSTTTSSSTTSTTTSGPTTTSTSTTSTTTLGPGQSTSTSTSTTSTTTIQPTSTTTTTVAQWNGYNLFPVYGGTCDSAGANITAYKYFSGGSIVNGDTLYATQNTNNPLGTGYYSDGGFRYEVNTGLVSNKTACSVPTSTSTTTAGCTAMTFNFTSGSSVWTIAGNQNVLTGSTHNYYIIPQRVGASFPQTFIYSASGSVNLATPATWICSSSVQQTFTASVTWNNVPDATQTLHNWAVTGSNCAGLSATATLIVNVGI